MLPDSSHPLSSVIPGTLDLSRSLLYQFKFQVIHQDGPTTRGKEQTKPNSNTLHSYGVLTFSKKKKKICVCFFHIYTFWVSCEAGEADEKPETQRGLSDRPPVSQQIQARLQYSDSVGQGLLLHLSWLCPELPAPLCFKSTSLSGRRGREGWFSASLPTGLQPSSERSTFWIHTT